MRLIDLSMPIWEGAGYGEILPWENVPVQFFEYMFYDQNGIRMTKIKFDDETASTFMTPYQGAPHEIPPESAASLFPWKLNEIPLERLILRDTVILDVPGEDYHEITAEEIDVAVNKADYREGDDVLVRTGWATTEKAYELGGDYCAVSPFWSYEACIRMGELMESKKSGIFMTDTALIMSADYQGYRWSIGEERMIPRPKPWPSSEARERLMDLDGQWTFDDMPSELGRGGCPELMAKTIATCKCLVNANQISSRRVKMIILPLLIKQGGASPCRFIAVEE